MVLSDFDYELPPDRIAQHPPAERDAARMLVVDRRRQSWEDCAFRDFPELLRGDELLVLNNTRVIPARLLGRRRGTRAGATGKHRGREYLSAEIEVLLTRAVEPGVWDGLVRPGRKVRVGERIVFGDDSAGGQLEAEVIGRGEFGIRRLRLSGAEDLHAAIERLGHMPLPPYISRPDAAEDRERYQTVFAAQPGAVAAPTAGLHFTADVLSRVRACGAGVCEVTLHVGLGTFQPIRTEKIENHTMHSEPYEIPNGSAEAVNRARAAHRPILAVGTTVVRMLESAAHAAESPGGAPPVGEIRGSVPASCAIRPGKGEAGIFIYPGYRFRLVDQMLTNFHLPKSSLLVMVCAFAGRELMLAAYRHAIESGYRFYSYGDCMLIR